MARGYLNRNEAVALSGQITAAVIDGIKNAAKATSVVASDKIQTVRREAFKRAVDEFYDDPSFTIIDGGYNRTRSLYKMFELEEELDGNGLKQPYYSYDDSKMTGFRDESRTNHSENGLFDQVYVKGWHGGAGDARNRDSGTPFVPHPSPGTPYYRTPLHAYRTWGRKAAILTPSPEERFEKYQDEGIRALQTEIGDLFQANMIAEITTEVNKIIRR